jgi:hypothetical protein
MDEHGFRALIGRLRTVTPPDCEDCDDLLKVFATLAAEHGWGSALATFDDVAAQHLPPSSAGDRVTAEAISDEPITETKDEN